MAEASIKLTSTEQDWWRPVSTAGGGMVRCPVCHCVVSNGCIEAHDKWHEDLAAFLKVLAGG